MCGLFLTTNQTIQEETLQNAIKTLLMRGPNEQNFINSNNVIFGHSRLSIRDLSSSNARQPFTNKSLNITIIYNGELWNSRELIEKLSLDKSNKYTEVELIIQVYKKYGTKGFNILEGMFAFCLFDLKINSIFLVRDHFGKKPLYFANSNNSFYAASLPSTLFVLGVPKIIKDSVIYEIAESRHIYGGIYKNVMELQPGSFAQYSLNTGQVKLESYFKPHQFVNENTFNQLSNSNSKEIKEVFTTLLQNAVSKRKCSEVESGVILSGGIDSSLISYFSKLNDSRTFLHLNSVDMSELSYAKEVASSLEGDLYSDYIDKNRFFANHIKTIKAWEYPLVHTNGVGIKLLAKFAKELGLKVLYGGEGADEIFGGYYYHRLSRMSSLIPKRLSSFVSTKSHLSEFISTQIINNSTAISNNKSNRLSNYHDCLGVYNEFLPKSESIPQALLLSELRDYLQPLLARADRLMMSESIELRMPFLDLDLISFAVNLPLKYKMGLFSSKRILREKCDELMPNINFKRRKIGFTLDYYKNWYEEYSKEPLDNVSMYFDCDNLISYYEKIKRYDILLRIASLSYLC
ncbi:asparagine synthase (glutamine-hydrolyzing) [Prochlorococcus marinus]|uniref:asparagine synthase (glutamine-hydrolyzing) n=1 Tax=Prochlorococcus marinus TaxID=1219 RepID=UPI0039AEEA9B